MTNYRRNIVPGGSYFFTVNLADRRSSSLTDNIAELRAAIRYARGRHPFTIEAIVVLPDHLHAIWTLPEGDADYSLRWRLIKSTFSRALPNGEHLSASRLGKGERGTWQRRYLGAHIARRAGLRAAHGLHSFQPGETWICHASEGLAAFVVSPDGEIGDLSRRLGGRCRQRSYRVWREVMGFAALNPSYETGCLHPGKLIERVGWVER